MRMYKGNHIADLPIEERFFCPDCGHEVRSDEDCPYCEEEEKDEIINEIYKEVETKIDFVPTKRGM